MPVCGHCGRSGDGDVPNCPRGEKNKKIDLSRKFVVDIPRVSVIITHAFDKCICVCGSAGIGRQAGLRCLCPTIDVWVQVPSPAPKTPRYIVLWRFCFSRARKKSLRRKIRRRLSAFMKSGAGYPTMKYRTMSAHSRYMIGWISLALPRTSLTSTCTMMPAPRPLVMVPVKAVNIIMTHGPMDSS